MTDERPDLEQILVGLKPFQLATVEHVFARLWGDSHSVDRFLVADEVGLGKTLVAKGVAAKAIDHLWDSTEETGRPITIVYICSNHQIARQNLARLSQLTEGVVQSNADRLTLLPLSLREVEGRRVQVIAFTPGTSLALGRATGKLEERALLKRMLTQAFPDHDFSGPTWTRYLAVGASDERFDSTEAGYEELGDLPESLIQQFRDHLLSQSGPGGDGLLAELLQNQEAWADHHLPGDEAVHLRKILISQTRIAMAHASIDLLRPDLVILDEFQRFKDLFADDSTITLTDAQKLAQQVISTEGAKTLVLSATPYKMYTLADDADGEDHYRDFTSTIAFLAGRQPAQQITRWLSTMRRGIMTGTPDSIAGADAAREQAEDALRSVMSRTERLAATADRNGMLTTKELGTLRLDSSDVRGWRALDDIAQELGVGKPVRVLACRSLHAQHDGFVGLQAAGEAARPSGARRQESGPEAPVASRSAAAVADDPGVRGSRSRRRQTPSAHRRFGIARRMATGLDQPVPAVPRTRRRVRERRRPPIHEEADLLRVERRAQDDRLAGELRHGAACRPVRPFRSCAGEDVRERLAIDTVGVRMGLGARCPEKPPQSVRDLPVCDACPGGRPSEGRAGNGRIIAAGS